MIAGLEIGELALWLCALALASVVAGFVAGLLGVGGGIVTVPVLYNLFAFMDIEPGPAMQLAVGTSLLTIIPTGIMSVRSHHKRGAVDWGIIKLWGPLALLGVICAVLVARQISGSWLSAVFAGVALAVAIDMIARRDGGAFANGFPNSIVRGAWGYSIGFLSTLMGIGGGTISVPVLSGVGYEIKRAVGTAAALGPIIAVPGAIGFMLNGLGVEDRPPFSLGYVNLAAFALLLPAGLLLPRYGAAAAHALKPRTLRLLFAGFLLLTALRMGYGAVSDLLL